MTIASSIQSHLLQAPKRAQTQPSFSLLPHAVPNKEEIWLQLHAPVVILWLFNHEGQLLQTKAGHAGDERWPLYNLPAGHYRIVAGDGSSLRFRIP